MLLPSAQMTGFRMRPSIVLFGDSITQFGFGGSPESQVGWAGLLSAAYTRRCDVLNRGFSGYNTNHALELLPRIFPKDGCVGSSSSSEQPELLYCTVFFGANDAALPGEQQHVPIEEYAANIDKLVNGIRASASMTSGGETALLPILLMTPPPVDEAAWCASRDLQISDRSNEVTRQYGLSVKQVAAKHEKCSVVDTWELLQGDTSCRGKYLSDGIHLNAKGNQRVYEGLIDVVRKDFPDLSPMSDDDGEGRYGTTGIPLEEKLWRELC